MLAAIRATFAFKLLTKPSALNEKSRTFKLMFSCKPFEIISAP